MISSEKNPMGTLIGDSTIRTNNNFVFLDNDVQDNYLEVWRPPQRPSNIEDVSVEYVVLFKYQFRPDLISQLFYNTPVMAWAVCYYNNILDPYDATTGIYVGRVLKIINKDYFNQVSA